MYKSEAVYSDHRKEKPEKALVSNKHGLVGKPDYILHTKDGLLPLEIKQSKKPSQPYFSHVMQLISYCLLIEETRGSKPKYGFIQYKEGKAFVIPYTEGRKSFLIKTMQQMRDGDTDSGWVRLRSLLSKLLQCYHWYDNRTGLHSHVADLHHLWESELW